MSSQPTMSDVARLAGVDASTVSRALNGRTPSSLRPETVAKVQAAAEQLGYRPNVLARGLRTQRTHTIGLLVPDVTNPFFPPIIRGIEDALIPTGHVLLTANTDNEPEREEQGLDNLIARQVDGVMLATSHLDVATDADRLAGIPTVLVNRRDRSSQVPAVLPDDVTGVRLVVEHLHRLGHRRIGLISGPPDTSTGRDRRDTFIAACADHGIVADRIVHADRYDLPSGRRAANTLLDGGTPTPTAVFASNDLLAVGALTAMRARGLRVPDDVSLAGYNDMPLVDLLDPALTTVRIDQYLMGRRAAEVMLELLDRDPALRADHRGVAPDVTIVPELIVRRSTGAPPAGA